MYTEGSNALKIEYDAYTTPRKNQTRKKSKKAVNIKLMKKRAVALVFIAFVMAFTVLIRNAAIAKEFDVLTQSRSELQLLDAKIVEKQMAAQGNLDPKRVAQEAERLGLRPPAKNQIKYISLGNTDNGEVLKTEQASTLSAFINRVSVILEYLY